MIDETGIDETGTNETAKDTQRVGFCQDCGRPLTRETVRAVGSGMFCEPCLEIRLAGTAGAAAPHAAQGGSAASAKAAAGARGWGNPADWRVRGFGQYPPPDGVFPPVDGSTPHPILAGLLGLIPGVGAMYNGQFAKGIAHFVIFAILKLMGNVSGIFEALAVLWCFYQAFEAYHTARARRDGTPLPDPFGLNNIGENMGFGPNARTGASPFAGQPGGGVPPVVPPAGVVYPPDASAGWSATVTPPPPVAPYMAPPPVPPVPAQDWGGAPVAYPPSPEVPPLGGYVPGAAGWAPVEAPVAAYPVEVVPAKPNRFPAAAVWLIGLGVVFLLLTLDSDRISISHAGPFFLAALAVWIFTRRMSTTGGLLPMEAEGQAYVPRVVCKLRAPALLLVTAVLLGLQSYHVEPFGSTWPLLVIAFGVMLLVERMVGRPVAVVPPPAPVVYPTSAADEAQKGGR